MKIFLSSTAYDLSDIRVKAAYLLEQNGHEVLFHESPTFPARIGLHSHDQCIEAVKDSDLVICLIDRRYGGKYGGAREKEIENQAFEILGSTKSGSKKKYKISIKASDLSITWLELITAHSNGIPVVTFARQRTLDEKETRRRNQFIRGFVPAYAEKNELFDLIDWITKQKANNWIAPFASIVDFEKKLLTWMSELEKAITAPAPDAEEQADHKQRICIIVEGEIDRHFVGMVINNLNLTQQFIIIPTYGKYNALNNFRSTIEQYSKVFHQVILLLDSDALTEGELSHNKNLLEQLITESGAKNVKSFFAHPSIESWIAAGLQHLKSPQLSLLPDVSPMTKHEFIRQFGRSTGMNIRHLLRNEFSIEVARSESPEFSEFIDYLQSLNRLA